MWNSKTQPFYAVFTIAASDTTSPKARACPCVFLAGVRFSAGFGGFTVFSQLAYLCHSEYLFRLVQFLLEILRMGGLWR
jgi:hypothetical protein